MTVDNISILNQCKTVLLLIPCNLALSRSSLSSKTRRRCPSSRGEKPMVERSVKFQVHDSVHSVHSVLLRLAFLATDRSHLATECSKSRRLPVIAIFRADV